MFLHGPDTGSPLVILTDYRALADLQLDDAYRANHPGTSIQHVLDFYRLGQTALPKSMWGRTTRVALFNHDTKPDAADRVRARTALARFLQARKPTVVAIIPNETGGEEKRGPTLCWQHFGAPDSAGNMRGTFHEYAPGQYVVVLHSMSPWQKQLQRWQQQRWLRRALAVSTFEEKLLTCTRKFTLPDDHALQALHGMEGKPLAIDIESIESTDTITAIGVSDGESAVSIPWHRFVPHGRQEPEFGIDDSPLRVPIMSVLCELFLAKTDKYFHNFTFDVPRLEKEGFEFGGDIQDTFAAHSIAFPELRHGLQHACADMMPVRPWKSLWHPKIKGVTREDEEFWSCDPCALRDYNCDDAYHTWHLAQKILPCVGIDP